MFWLPFATQAAFGLSQMAAGALKPKVEMPEYEVSPEATSFYNTARNEVGGLSNQAKEAMVRVEKNAATQSSQVERSATSGGQALRGSLAITSATNDALSNIMLNEASTRENRIRNLATGVAMVTGERQKRFDSIYGNQMLKYQERANLINAGMGNFGMAGQSLGEYYMAKAMGDTTRETI